MLNQTPEEHFNEIFQNLFKLSLIDYKKMIINYLKEGDSWTVFNKEVLKLYDDEYNNFHKSNLKFIDLMRLFRKLKDRKDINKFNKAISSNKFEDELGLSPFAKSEFIKLYSQLTSLETMKIVHSENRYIVRDIFSIYYDKDKKHKIDILNLPIFHGSDSENIKKTKNKLEIILFPKPKKQNLYPLHLFGVEYSSREVATLVIFMQNFYNIKPKHKTDLVNIAYIIFGDINQDLQLNRKKNSSALNDFIRGDRLFTDYNFDETKKKIIKSLKYKGNTQFKSFISYIESQDLISFKNLIE